MKDESGQYSDSGDSRNVRIVKLMDFRKMARECLEDTEKNQSIQPRRVSDLISIGEDFGLVSREGMAKGLHYPHREKSYLKRSFSLDENTAVPVLKHVLKQATRALNIERRGGHEPRERKPLYGEDGAHAKRLRYR